jgi:HlyD family secretion protein
MHKQRYLFSFILVVAVALAACSGTDTSSVSGEGVVSSISITDKIETTGNLSAGQLVQLTWGTDGLIEQVNVKVGQKVKEGEVLAALQADSVATDMITAQATLATAIRDLEDLENSKVSQAQAQQAVLDTREAVETAQNNLDALAYPRASEVLIKNTQAKIWESQKSLTIAYKKYKELQHHLDGDPEKTAALLALTNEQMKYNDLVNTMNWYIAKPSQADYDDAKIALDLARARWDAAKRQRDIVKNGADPLALSAARARVASAQSVVNGIQAIAPFDGEILAVQAVVGNAVKKGESSVALVDRNTLKIDTQIDETSIGSVSIGDSAEVTMESLGGEALKGKVTLINPIGSTVGGLVKYTVTISLEPTERALLFGATVSVVITTGEPHSMLAVPVNAVQSDAAGEYLMVLGSGDNVRRVNVVSGDLADSLVTVTTSESLAEGDRVQLSSSSSSSSSSSNSGNNRNQGIPIPGVGGPPGG